MQKDQHRDREKPPKLRGIYVAVVTTTPNRMNKKAWVHITLHTRLAPSVPSPHQLDAVLPASTSGRVKPFTF